MTLHSADPNHSQSLSGSLAMTGSSFYLPPEIWLHIHRLATSHTSPLAKACSDRFEVHLVILSDPFKDMAAFLRDALSFSLVSKLWKNLANELFLENIVVDQQPFDSLLHTLQLPEKAHLVRSIKLSSKRFDRNVAILACCPRVEVIVQPDERPRAVTDTSLWIANDPSFNINAELRFLKHIYWTESYMSSGGLLRKLVLAAPNLEHLFLSESGKIPASREPLELPLMPTLRRLGLGVMAGWDVTRSILQVDLRNLARLSCTPEFIEHADFPATIPSLHALHLSGFRSKISFPTVFARFPHLQELCYHVWDSFSHPGEQQRSRVSLVRLYSSVSMRVVQDWKFVDKHFTLLLSAKFPQLQRIVLYGSWHNIIDDMRFVRFREGLRARGCQLEHPEGDVLN
ncbi:hypothetical protein GGX14DRAFT_662326 [Mycena pura]|uniref:Uncharacterized protein n=1 Tax=Mycena pura TaxID=153505 RepID=A0AAD6UZU2_9AGAR|nr:hypothetical protein GGX14DRAFT_662326 [Mycena pura]